MITEESAQEIAIDRQIIGSMTGQQIGWPIKLEVTRAIAGLMIEGQIKRLRPQMLPGQRNIGAIGRLTIDRQMISGESMTAPIRKIAGELIESQMEAIAAIIDRTIAGGINRSGMRR